MMAEDRGEVTMRSFNPHTWVAYAAAAMVALGCAGCASSAVTVPNVRPMDFSHGTTLALSGGVAFTSSTTSTTGGLVGGDIGWEITPRIGIQGSGSWLDRGPGATAFAAALTGQFSIRRPHPLVPFVEGGFGMYRAAFDSPRSVPGFYSGRITSGMTGASAFRDPLFVAGAGVNLFVTRRIAIRPAAEVFVVTRGSQSYTMGMFTMRAVYHFENHPITP